MALTGKTIGELTNLLNPTNDTLIPVEYSGQTYHIAYSSSTYTEVVYTGLTSMMTANELVIGKHYLITDFKTCYDQPDYDYNGSAITVGNYKQGSVSPILVLATGTGTISQLAYQPEYPGDVIYYDSTFSVTEVTGGEAFGRITYRIDDKGNAFDYDFREVLFKRYNTYVANGSYDGRVSIDGSGNVTGTGTFFQSTVSTGSIIGIVNSNREYGVDFYEVVSIASDTSMIVTGNATYSVSNTIYTPSSTENGMSYKPSNIIGNTGFTEYNTFTSYDECFNNTCGNRVSFTIWEGSTFLLSNNVFRDGEYVDNSFGSEFRNNTFNDDCTGNTIKYRFYNNVIDNDFDDNIITSDFYNNMIVCDFVDNYVQSNFYNNNLGDDDGDTFGDNIINGSFNGNFHPGNGDFQYNTINGSFSSNIILDRFEYNNVQSFNSNTIEDSFDSNQIADGFTNNLIKQNFNDNVLGSNANTNIFYGNFEKNTGGVNVYDNNFYNNVVENNLGNDFYNNEIGDVDNIQNYSFDHNSFQGNCYNNTITGNTQFNKVGHYLYGNTIATNFSYNQIGDYFNSNTIANDFGYGGGSYRGNVIGNGFQGNNIGEYFYDNTIADGFGFNQVQDYFVNNKISYGMQNTTFADLDASGHCENNNFTFTGFTGNLTLSGGTGGNPIFYTNISVNVVRDAADNSQKVTFLSGGTIVAQSTTI
jgi:hypothetical protein